MVFNLNRFASLVVAPRVLAAALMALGVSSHAAAQVSPDPGLNAPIRLGPIGLSPELTVTTLWDSNVLNQPDQPGGDLVSTTRAATGLAMRAGRARIAGKTSAVYDHYRDGTYRPGLSTSSSLRVSAPMNRFAPYAEATYTDTKQRAGLEIDIRARNVQRALRVGTTAQLGGRTSLEMWSQKTHSGYLGDTAFRGVDLNSSLGQKAESAGATFGVALTPVSQLTVNASLQRDRFDEALLRNADSARLTLGLQTDALFKGSIAVGIRHFAPRADNAPRFQGVVATGSIGTELFGRTQLVLSVDRDVQFSYATENPYYVQTSAGVSVTQALGRGVRAAARVGHQQLAYRAFTDTESPESGRTDRGLTYGATISYQLSRTLHIQAQYDYSERTSPTRFADYKGERMGVSVSYAF